MFDWLRCNAGLFAYWNGSLTLCLKLAYLRVLSIVLVSVPLPNICPRYAFWTRKRHHLVSHLNRVAARWRWRNYFLKRKFIPLITRQLKFHTPGIFNVFKERKARNLKRTKVWITPPPPNPLTFGSSLALKNLTLGLPKVQKGYLRSCSRSDPVQFVP